jgi:predicted Zn-dependent protease with MMP-like domain
MDKNFDQMVNEAIDNIPKQYSDKLDNVIFKIEDEPSFSQRNKLGLRKCDALFGLYEGVPLTRRGGAVHSIVPDVITIFRIPMIQIFTNKPELKAQIFETVWHEVAHYFGLNHQRIHSAKNKS